MNMKHYLPLLLILPCTLINPAARAGEDGLIGHWKLHGDGLDSSGNGHHATNHGADFSATGPGGQPRTAARFDGRASFLEVPHRDALHLGEGDFTIAVWAFTESELDDVLGDIAAKFDPVRRKGFNFGILNANVTTNQSNYRNVYFGIDDGRATKPWIDCGRPGRSVYTQALAVYDGRLYAGSCEPGQDESGHVYRWEGDTRWADCGSPDRCNSVAALAVYRGRLYAGVSKYRLAGSSLTESANRHSGGKVYRYDGDGRWADCGKVGEAEAIGGLAVYRGRLFASSTYAPGGVYEYDGAQGWTFRGRGPQEKRIVALAVYNGSLYGTSYDGGRIYRYDGGTAWSLVGEIPGATQTYGFAVNGGRLYVSTWPKGEVHRYEGDRRWTNCGRLGQELEVMGLAVYNGKLYAGTLPLAQVFRYDGDAAWISTGRLDTTPDVRYRRAWTMAVFQGRLFCGTLPSGRVYAFEAGRNVTLDRELEPGWRHLAAVRAGGVLKLYVDGRPAASSVPARAGEDISNDRPLTIGFGAQDYFHGALSDLRLFRRALTEAEIGALARRR
jgi:hypothetical protein